MKVFAKVLAILAVLLVLLSLFAVVIFTIFQVPFSDAIFPPSGRRSLEKFPVVLGGTILAMVLQVFFTAPMAFLAGRKKGGIWIEIALVLLMVLTIPITKMVGDFLCWFLICYIPQYKFSIDPAFCLDRYYIWFSLERAYRLYRQPFVKVWMQWLCAPAEIAQVLMCIVCGVSAGLRLKATKARKQAAMLAPDAENICE